MPTVLTDKIGLNSTSSVADAPSVSVPGGRSNFFEGHEGTIPHVGLKRRIMAPLRDGYLDLALASSRALKAIDRAKTGRQLNILIAGIEVPSRARDIHSVIARLKSSSQHNVDSSVAPMREGLGKFANITAAIETAQKPVSDYDWLLIVDDDIAFDRHMLHRLLYISETQNFSLSQPAHRYRSYAMYQLTRRQPGSLARKTRFVEIGPVTAIHRRAFEHLLPFPESRWGYGIDALWSEKLLEKGLSAGVVDAATIRHLRPVANGYSINEAREEGAALLESVPAHQTRAEMLQVGEVILPRD